jgi:alpha-1,6-mannosyltransferase
MILFEIVSLQMSSGKLFEIIKYGAIASIVSLILSVPIDTFFWGLQYDIRYRIDSKQIFVMWPELHSFYFNGVQNKSSDWGVSPWHWYFLAAIPKSVTCAIPFAFIGLIY